MGIKKIIKSLFLICFFFLSTSICLANENLEIQLGSDYLITTDDNIKTTFVANPDIITLSPFFTIFNEKNVLLLHPQKVGKSSFTIFLDKSNVIFNVVVTSGKKPPVLKPIKLDNFEIMLLDAPPELEEIDTPPTELKKEVK